jgi:hypothetical protein
MSSTGWLFHLRLKYCGPWEVGGKGGRTPLEKCDIFGCAPNKVTWQWGPWKDKTPSNDFKSECRLTYCFLLCFLLLASFFFTSFFSLSLTFFRLERSPDSSPKKSFRCNPSKLSSEHLKVVQTGSKATDPRRCLLSLHCLEVFDLGGLPWAYLPNWPEHENASSRQQFNGIVKQHEILSICHLTQHKFPLKYPQLLCFFWCFFLSTNRLKAGIRSAGHEVKRQRLTCIIFSFGITSAVDETPFLKYCMEARSTCTQHGSLWLS